MNINILFNNYIHIIFEYLLFTFYLNNISDQLPKCGNTLTLYRNTMDKMRLYNIYII